MENKCKKHFFKDNSIIVKILPEKYVNLIIYRWFNTKTNIDIDILNWGEDGFDFAIHHPYEDSVLLGERFKDFDVCIKMGIKRAALLYNEINHPTP